MCGIVGVAGSLVATQPNIAHQALVSATEALKHRGPDGNRVELFSDVLCGLGHTRLSILDLHDTAAQPMRDATKRFSITFNGEIYNYQSLRSCLIAEGFTFTSTGDTEVLLRACIHWGVEETLHRVRGMFAFGFIDHDANMLTLARDRFGEKPLYYGIQGGSLSFGSEVKAVLPFLQDAALDPTAIAGFLRYQYCPAPTTAFQNIRQVLPGQFIQIRLSDHISPTDLSSICYYNVEQIAIQARNTPYTGTFSQATERFTELLENSVAQQLVSDVPLGAFLSGGIDSSLVVASMAKLSKSPVLTFSIGFEEDSFNEAQHAREVANHLGTTHTEFIVTDAEALAVIPKLARHFDDPFGDSSEIPTLLLTELTRRHVTVALSGDGGDELFGGYNRYFIGANLWSKVGHVPQPIRRGGSRILRAMSSERLDQVGRAVSINGRYFFDGRLSARASKLASLLDLNRLDEVYKAVVSHWTDDIVISARWLDSAIDHMGSLSPAEQMMILDTQRYLPSDILVKVDRASMANSLETRVPFLDPDLFEFAWSLPLEYKIKGREGKIISKAALEKMVPRQLWDRPKKGFAIPLEKWLKHGLRDWAEELLLDQSIAPGLLDNNAVMNCWTEHQNGESNNQDRLWDVLMLKMWIKEWVTPD